MEEPSARRELHKYRNGAVERSTCDDLYEDSSDTAVEENKYEFEYTSQNEKNWDDVGDNHHGDRGDFDCEEPPSEGKVYICGEVEQPNGSLDSIILQGRTHARRVLWNENEHETVLFA